MEFIKVVKTANFALYMLGGVDADGNAKFQIKPVSETGKKLLRFKSWTRGTEVAVKVAALLTFIAELEAKADILSKL